MLRFDLARPERCEEVKAGETMKTCNKCGGVKPVSEFGRNKKMKDGLKSHCKVCDAEYNRKWREENPEKVNEASRKYYGENRGKVQSIRRKYYEENRGKVRESSRKYYEENREKVRGSRLKGRYGITPETYEQMLEAQNAGCLVSGKPHEPEKGQTGTLHVDHCHDTGKVRGLLHNNVNTAIGLLDDDPNQCFEAGIYLLPHKPPETLTDDTLQRSRKVLTDIAMERSPYIRLLKGLYEPHKEVEHRQ